MIKKIVVVMSNVCNFRCKDCYTVDSESEKEVISDEVIDNIADLIEDQEGVKHLIISGGEPTLHLSKLKRLLKIKKAINKKVISNGWWIRNETATNAVISLFKEMEITTLQFSCGVMHQRFLSATEVERAADFALERGAVKEVVISYEINRPKQINDAKKLFQPIKSKYGDSFRALIGYWNGVEAEGCRVDGRHQVTARTEEWCEWLRGDSQISINYDGCAHRCCGGLILKDEKLYYAGNMTKNNVILPFSKNDPLSSLFREINMSGHKTDIHDFFKMRNIPFKCERCRKMAMRILTSKRPENCQQKGSLCRTIA